MFLAWFVPWLRLGVGPLAGLSRMPYPRFVAYDLAAALALVSTLIGAGYLGGPYLDRVMTRLWRVQELTVALILLLWVGWRLTARWRQGLRQG